MSILGSAVSAPGALRIRRRNFCNSGIHHSLFGIVNDTGCVRHSFNTDVTSSTRAEHSHNWAMLIASQPHVVCSSRLLSTQLRGTGVDGNWGRWIEAPERRSIPRRCDGDLPFCDACNSSSPRFGPFFFFFLSALSSVSLAMLKVMLALQYSTNGSTGAPETDSTAKADGHSGDS